MSLLGCCIVELRPKITTCVRAFSHLFWRQSTPCTFLFTFSRGHTGAFHFFILFYCPTFPPPVHNMEISILSGDAVPSKTIVKNILSSLPKIEIHVHDVRYHTPWANCRFLHDTNGDRYKQYRESSRQDVFNGATLKASTIPLVEMFNG